jgi:hypothetical protein
MPQQKKSHTSPLRKNVLNVSHVHFLYVLALAVQIIIYDSWKVLTPEAVMGRWIVTASLFVFTTVVWYLAKSKPLSATAYRNLVILLVLADIFVASYAVYTQRGMASRGVFLYAIPIITSAVLLSRSAILAATALCVAAYTTTAISYFVLNFNEGYKVELYGEVGFYSIMMLVAGLLLWAIVRSKRKT